MLDIMDSIKFAPYHCESQNEAVKVIMLKHCGEIIPLESVMSKVTPEEVQTGRDKLNAMGNHHVQQEDEMEWNLVS